MVEPIHPPSGNEILVDGVDEMHIHENVFRCTLFTRQRTGDEVRPVEAVRLAVPISELPDIIQAFVTVLTQAAKAVVRPVLS